ncbi:MAG: glycoside hydrolase family 97 protein [Phycisphaerae bacterium]|nr:glycoside hydrolase family 97 protein [Phycisphaerae bacterium]
MHRIFLSSGFVLVGLGFAMVSARARADAVKPVTVTSPGGHVHVQISLHTAGQGGAVPRYRVTFKERPVIVDSPLQIDLADGTRLGSDSVIEGARTTTIDTEYRQHPGKRSRVVDHGFETVISLHERREPVRKWELVVRAYDEGAALRYRFPRQQGCDSLVVASERTGVAFPEGTIAFALPLNSFTTPYEKRYQRKLVAELPADWLLGLPLLVEVPGTAWAAVTEANLTDYAGMYLARQSGTGAALVSRLSPLPEEPKVAVRATLPHDSPWRVVLIADKPEKLIGSDLLLNLNAPCAIKETSWIKSGKTTFPWWNGFYEENLPFKCDLNTATAKYYIDFCAEAGIPCHSLDGRNDLAWYGGPIGYQGADPTKAVDGLDIPEILRHAKHKGVRIRLWMHWMAARNHMTHAFPLYREWGIEGVMVDFMDRDDQQMVRFLHDLLKLAAENQLTVTLHGVSKPTGLERTFPNLLTSEAVLSLEYDKWDKVGVLPEHEVMVPFTRMLAGPLDFHQGSFRTVPVANFKPRNAAPLIMGTPCRTLASYVVFQNHLPMVADYPSAYRGHPLTPVLARIPTTWDDTIGLAGAPGEYVVVARRSGSGWWIGAMTNREAREIEIPLGFLGGDRYHAAIYRDELTAAHGVQIESRRVKDVHPIRVRLDPGGGCVMNLLPLTANP